MGRHARRDHLKDKLAEHGLTLRQWGGTPTIPTDTLAKIVDLLEEKTDGHLD